VSAVRKSAIVALGVTVAGVVAATPAGADPGNDPCASTRIPICRMLPIMPDLDHDIDLTQDPDGLSGVQGPGNQAPATGTPGPGGN
jgi:hypothetical protein